MTDRTYAGVAAVALLLVASVAPAVAASGAQSSMDRTNAKTYAGSHVSFTASGDAVSDYSVEGEEMLATVAVENSDDYHSRTGLGLDVGLDSVVGVDGGGVDLTSKTDVQATVDVEGSAEMRAHDDGHGVLVVSSGENAQYVEANVSEGAEATAEGDSRVVVTSADGTKGSFVVVGEGDVAVNDDGDVTAQLESDSKLVFRAYPEGRDEADRKQEKLIANGTATAEVYVMEEDGETVTDTVTYSQETTVTAEQSAEDEVQVTVDRTASEGKVVVTSVSKAAVGSTDDLNVRVDGEAAAKASSYSELQGAIGSDQSKYLVAEEGSAKARTDVLVAVNHFSERQVTVSGADSNDGGSGGDDGSSGDGSDSDSTDAQSQPGFGLLAGGVALAALVAVGLARRKRD